MYVTEQVIISVTFIVLFDNCKPVAPEVNTSIGTRTFAVSAPSLWNMLSSSVKSVEHIAKLSFKDTLLQHCLSTIAPWRISQFDDIYICLLTLRSINPFVLMRL